MGTTEKRRHERSSENVCTWLSFCDDRKAYSTLTLDLGVEGARFATPRRVEEGDQLKLDLLLDPDCQTIECRATVRWAFEDSGGHRQFGVHFHGLMGEKREHLQRFLHDSPSISQDVI